MRGRRPLRISKLKLQRGQKYHLFSLRGICPRRLTDSSSDDQKSDAEATRQIQREYVAPAAAAVIQSAARVDM